jgi:TPP-dependent trihydroxycyclohexane-1,2-dione (THcHDO) dehydratase
MALPIILSALSAISSSLKIVEFVESHGLYPTGDELISLQLQRPNEQGIFQSAAQQLSNAVGDAEDELFKDTEARVAKCLRKLNDAMNDPDHLPDDRRRFGTAARKCICREVVIVRDLGAGTLPPDLDKLWAKYKCMEVGLSHAATA